MNLNEKQIQFFGLSMIFYVVVTMGFSSFFELITSAAKKNIANPIMTLEFIRKAGDVEEIIKSNNEARKGLKTFLILDTFAFVLCILRFCF